MYKINTVFVRFRFRQFVKIAKEIPIPYLFILTGMAVLAFFFLLHVTEEKTGSIWTGAVFLLLIFIFHRNRKDFRFLQLIASSPHPLFLSDYIGMGIPVLILELLHGHLGVAVGIVLGCAGISCLKQSPRRRKRISLSPRFIPREAIEWKTGIRQQGIILLVVYIGAYAGLALPYLSFAFAWLFTCILTDFFHYSESVQILCAPQLPAKRFLNRKLKVSLFLYGTALLPVYLLYGIFYPAHELLPVLFFVYGMLNIVLMVVSKYALFSPNTVLSTGQPGLLLSLFGMVCPVLLPVTLFFIVKKYRTAYQNLNTYLYAYN